MDAIKKRNNGKEVEVKKAKAAESLGMTPRALRYRLTAMREQGVNITF